MTKKDYLFLDPEGRLISLRAEWLSDTHYKAEELYGSMRKLYYLGIDGERLDLSQVKIVVCGAARR